MRFTFSAQQQENGAEHMRKARERGRAKIIAARKRNAKLKAKKEK